VCRIVNVNVSMFACMVVRRVSVIECMMCTCESVCVYVREVVPVCVVGMCIGLNT